MYKKPVFARLLVEELERRSTPAVLNAMPVVSDHSAAHAAAETTGAQADDAPLHVSLAAVVAIALCVGWDRRAREHHFKHHAELAGPAFKH